MNRTRKDHITFFKAVSNFLYDHFKKIVIFLIILMGVSQVFINYIAFLKLPVSIIISIVFLIVVINFIVKKGIESIYSLIGNKSKTIEEIVGDYAIAVIFTVLFFAFIYAIADSSGIGYLKYGTCGESFTFKNIPEDPQIIKSSFSRVYFSAVTFFTVGYGDICPMGYSKIISILNAMTGSIINIIILSIAIGQYLNTGKTNKKEKTNIAK
jgi:hypothetical protein